MKLKNVWQIKAGEKIYRPKGNTYEEWQVTRPVFDSRNWKENIDPNRMAGMPLSIEMQKTGVTEGKHLMTKIEPDENDQVYVAGEPEKKDSSQTKTSSSSGKKKTGKK